MKHKKVIPTIFSTIIFAIIVFGATKQVQAQQDVVKYLETRLRQQGVPVVEIIIIQEFPLQIEVILQSQSDGITGVPEDPIYLLLLEREIILAKQKGYFIDRYTRITLSNSGDTISYSDSRVKMLENIFLDTSPSQSANDVTERRIRNEMRLFGLSLAEMHVSSENGLQSLMLNLSVPSISEANASLPDFMKSLLPTVNNINNTGSHIIIYQLQLRDNNGKMLLNYIRDLQIGSERWWMEENLTSNWFSIPAPIP